MCEPIQRPCFEHSAIPFDEKTMNRFPLRLKFIFVAVLLLAMLAAIVLWHKGSSAPRLTEPKDQELIATFYADRKAFERLREMAAEDARGRWYLGVSDPSTLSQSRRSEYKNLMSQINPKLQAAMNGTTGVVRFIFVGEGTAIGPGWVKGIEYVPGDYSREGVLLPDLNKAASLPANVYIREIEPTWLIFYQRDE